MVWSFRKVMVIVFSMVLLYLVGIFSIYISIDFLIYSPEKLNDNSNFTFSTLAQEVKLTHPDGSYIICPFLLPKQTPKAAVLFLHDGQNNTEHFAEHADLFLERGLAILMVDYRSFGKSKGETGEIPWMEDGLISLQWLNTKFQQDSIMLYGIGMGAYVAAYLSSVFPSRLSVLEDPVYDLKILLRRRYPSLILPYELKYDYDTYKYLPNSIGPVFIIAPHSSAYCGKKEFQQLKSILVSENNFVEINLPAREKLIHQHAYIHFLDQITALF